MLKNIIDSFGKKIREHIAFFFIIPSALCFISTLLLIGYFILWEREVFSKIEFFYAILVIFGGIFAGSGFLVIFNHTKDLFREQQEKISKFINQLISLHDESKLIKNRIDGLYQFQRELAIDEKSNIGIGLLAVATIFWQFSNLAHLFIINEGKGSLIEKVVDNVIFEQTSILNSACFLGIVTTLRVTEGYLPKWWDSKYVKVFRRYRHIFVITMLISALQFFLFALLILPDLDTSSVLEKLIVKIPDLLFSIITITILWISLQAVFKERKLQFKWLLSITMILTLLAQFNDSIGDILNANENIFFIFYALSIGLFFKVGLLLILFSLSYSWRYYIDRKTIDLLVGFKDSIIFELKNDLERQRMLKRQMNHAVRGSLGYLINTASKNTASEKSLTIASENLKFRLISIYCLHDDLHNSDNVSLETDLSNYLTKLSKSLHEAHGYESSQFEVRIGIDNFIVLFDHARDIGIILTELVINSVKAQEYKNKEKRKIIIELKVVDQNLLLSVEDYGVGYKQDKVSEGYGNKVIKQILTGVDGKISTMRCIHEGTKIVVTIPIEFIKI